MSTPKRPRLSSPPFLSTGGPDPVSAAEAAVGITEYIHPPLLGWQGVLKKRYTDFLVNEIDSRGEVVRLHSLGIPGRQDKRGGPSASAAPRLQEGADEKERERQPAFREPTGEELSLLVELTDEATKDACLALLSPESDLASAATPHIASKDQRSRVHVLIRAAFSSRLITQTLDESITIQRASHFLSTNDRRRSARGGKNRKQRQGESQRSVGGAGDFCHFTLYKENRDTMEVLNLLPRLLRLKPGSKAFSFAGTKDRRAVTVQRCAGFKIRAERLVGLNKGGDGGLRTGVRLGDFKYEETGLELGDLKGNEFVITLRECECDKGRQLEEVVGTAVDEVKRSGFANYFGLQRFGSREDASTADIGMLLLRGEWRKAAETILRYDPALVDLDDQNAKISTDDLARAKACETYFTTYGFAEAAERMPRRFLAESSMLRALAQRGIHGDGKGGGLDYLGAIQAIPRNLRTMYVHAYQSLIWNSALSARLRLSRTEVIPGDLVIAERKPSKQNEAVAAVSANGEVEMDQDGDVVVTAPVEEEEEGRFERARSITAGELASGKFTVRDVVLPTPGWDVVYPANEELMGVYKSLMAEHGLDPLDMKRPVRDWSLPGSYRKIVAGFVDDECSWEVKQCALGEQVVQTDLERIDGGGGTSTETGEKRKREYGEASEGEETVVVLKMRLGTSCYATMALRELTKGGAVAYKVKYGRPALGRESE